MEFIEAIKKARRDDLIGRGDFKPWFVKGENGEIYDIEDHFKIGLHCSHFEANDWYVQDLNNVGGGKYSQTMK